MTSGTIGVLFAEHSIIHSILVILAWKRLYKRWPKFWEMCCIFLHDIGLFGMSFLETHSNKGHELLGAKIAGILFGKKGYDLVYHHRATNPPCSLLEAPDDYSWCLAPIWWLKLTWIIQRKRITQPEIWKRNLCERWVRRFNGEMPSSLWNTVAIPLLKNG
jgi:hypothetical protein